MRLVLEKKIICKYSCNKIILYTYITALVGQFPDNYARGENIKSKGVRKFIYSKNCNWKFY